MFRRISYLIVVVGSLLASCRGETVIPKSELKDIYVDMLLADQWIIENRRQQRIADTSYVYRPFLESRGYTEEDFIRTVNLYTRMASSGNSVSMSSGHSMRHSRPEKK